MAITSFDSKQSDSAVEDIVNNILQNGFNSGAITPTSDVSHDLGTSEKRFNSIHGSSLYGTAHYADIIFQEKQCAICEEEFQVGDKIQLIVTKVVDEGSEEDGTYMVPIHGECS